MSSEQPMHIIPRLADGEPAPLSFGQERLFLLDRIMPGMPAYNVPRLVRVRATLDESLLERALNAIVARHEILRTTIRLEDGAPVQEVAASARVELATLDLRGAGETAEAEAHAFLAELACRPFDLSGDVLLRAAVVHRAIDEDLLLLVNHHVGSDHASAEILFAELDELYDALGAGREPNLPELAIQYADFARWQRERLTGELLEELTDFWVDRLADAPARLDLPSDRARPAAQSYRGELCEFALRPELGDGIRALARSQSASVYMVLVAAFKTLLHRYTGVEDVVIGSPVSGRLEEEIEPLLGFFSNTLVLRTDLSGEPTFSELVGRVKLTTLEARANQELPFEKLVEQLNPSRTPAFSPLFQVLLGFDVAPARQAMLAGAPVEELPIPGWRYARLDLSLIVREQRDGSLVGSIEYATDLFDRATIERLAAHLECLLESAVEDPEKRLSELELLTGAEFEQLVVTWNDTGRPYPRGCLHELFAEQAQRRPEASAVVSENGRLSYRELDERANRLANELIALGVRHESLVGICLERSPDLVVALLGVLKTGAAYVPVDPSYPRDRRDFIFGDSGVPVVVTHEALAREIDLADVELLCVDRDRERIEAREARCPEITHDPEQLAYVIYTSGSTGRPKGVEVTHRSVANLIAHMRTAPGVDESDVVANLTTPAFDLSVPDWYLPLTSGATLAIVPPGATQDPFRLGEELTRLGTTFAQATPTTWQLLVDADWPGTQGLKVVAGGEALPRGLAEDLRSFAELWHAYGPTETTVWSSLVELGPVEGARRRSAARSRTPSSTCSTRTGGPFRSAFRVSCTSAAPGSPAATTAATT